MKTIIACATALALSALGAQAAAQMPRFELKPIERPAEPGSIPLYPAGTLPNGADPERWSRLLGYFPDGSQMDARIARNVAEPTMTPVLPDPFGPGCHPR